MSPPLPAGKEIDLIEMPRPRIKIEMDSARGWTASTEAFSAQIEREAVRREKCRALAEAPS